MLHKFAEMGSCINCLQLDPGSGTSGSTTGYASYQVEGVVCDKGLTLGDLIGVIRQFFAQLGMTQVRFKPAFNPYTEPSMEIFAFHPMLGKWVEVGNSGMFRPEMLLPMGLPEDVNVIAWGLSLETTDDDHVRN